MIHLSLRVTLEGSEPREVPVNPSTIVAFERQFQTGLAKAFDVDQRFEHMLWIGWHASKKAGLTSDEFDVWVDKVAALEPVNAPSLPLADTP